VAELVVDTTVLIDVLRGSTVSTAWLSDLIEPPYCSEISRVEIIRGLRSGERHAAESLFAGLEWVPVTESVSRLAGDLGRQYRRSHQGIGPADLVVAATTQWLASELATHNVKHFPMFPGLRPPY
jgi:predicted nucleic acid-binding protein